MNLQTVKICEILVEVAPSNKLQQKSLIETDGNIEPIRLGVTEEGSYWIIDGRRRLTDLIELGKTEVLAIIDKDVEQDKGHLQALILNSGKPNQMDESDHIQYLLNEGYTVKEISAKCNIQSQIIYSRMKLQLLISEIKELLRKGEIKYSAAKVIATTTKEEQKELLEQVQKLTYKNVSKFLSQIQSNSIDIDGFDFDLPNTDVFTITENQIATLSAGGILEIGGIKIKAENLKSLNHLTLNGDVKN